jgi:hypothetical protein
MNNACTFFDGDSWGPAVAQNVQIDVPVPVNVAVQNFGDKFHLHIIDK